MPMVWRWLAADGPYTDLTDPGGRAVGSVRPASRGRWWGWVVASCWAAFFPTRAAAMRAVAGRCDAKKGYGL